jgi:hypothetical protein
MQPGRPHHKTPNLFLDSRLEYIPTPSFERYFMLVENLDARPSCHTAPHLVQCGNLEIERETANDILTP